MANYDDMEGDASPGADPTKNDDASNGDNEQDMPMFGLSSNDQRPATRDLDNDGYPLTPDPADVPSQGARDSYTHGSDYSQENGMRRNDDVTAGALGDDNINEDREDNQVYVMDTTEHEPMQGRSSGYDTTMAGLNDGLPALDGAAQARLETARELQEGTEFMPGGQNEDDQFEDDSSLFVPEQTPAHRPTTHQRSSMNMPPPPRSIPPPSVRSRSIFNKIRSMQKANVDRRNATRNQSSARQYTAEPDNETYLEAVLSPITPLPSTPAPTVSEDDVADRQALAEFQRRQRHYSELKHNNNGLTFRESVEWMKIQAAENARKQKRVRDLAKALEDEGVDPVLFPGVDPRLDAGEENTNIESDDGNGFQPSGSSRKRQRREMPSIGPIQWSMQEAELRSMKVALDACEDVPKKKKKTQAAESESPGARAKGKGKATTKSNLKPRNSKGVAKTSNRAPRRTAKSKREVDHALKQATSLFNANVFEQQAGEDELEQPTFGATRNKQDALKELIASVPIEDKKQARSDMAILLAATRDFDGRYSVKPAGGNWLVKGMKTSLKGYQVLGSAFMRRRENAAEEPRGGLSADQMGLGKTLMMLANIVNGQPPKGTHPRTTLLVASPSLLSQWAKEIEQHTNCGLKILRYGSGNRLESNHLFDILMDQDIVLTTYGEVMKSYPKNEPPIECQTAVQKMEWWKSTFDNHRGDLHRVMFLRVVLDEAQIIKNHTGRTSIACRALIARHKWALSGTPILNSLTELYPYFKFLGVPHTGSFKIFKQNYCDTKDAQNTERLLVRLSTFMLRRTHADRLFNAPILKLPRADQGTYWCDFNPVERCIYDIVHQRFAKRINMWQSKGELDKSYSNALVMLLRLRQLTAHVLMLQFVMRDLLEFEDIERIKDVVKEQAGDSRTQSGRTIIAIRKQLEKHASDQKKKAAADAIARTAGRLNDASEDEDDIEEEHQSQEPDEIISGTGKQFGKEFDFKPFLRSLKIGDSWERAKKNARCSYCDSPPRRPWIASCGHLICETPCLESSNLAAAESGESYSACKTCGITSHLTQPCEFDEEDPEEGVAQGTRSKAKKKKESQRKRLDREDISEDWLSLAGADVLPSAKTLAIKAQILNWTKEDPKVKIIIYTQFLAM
jgi:SNF2 family DNA or RNA helicase